MQTKVQAYVQLADETSLKITGNYLDWLSFLTTASRLYKYPYHDQLMIYAQRPDASACAAYELWNGTMHRYIRRGAKGIALLNPTANGMRIRYVFDVSDTGTRADSRNVDVWQLTEAAEPAVRKMLSEEFSANASMRLSSQIDQLAERQALAYWNEHRRDILDSVDDSALSEYDDFAAGASFRKAAAASISAVIQTRCGLEPELLRGDFQEVMDWNTPAAAAELGKAVSTIAEQVLRQIERTVRNAERSMEHERTEVHTARGLPAAGNGPDRRGTAAAGQVRMMRQQYLASERPGLYTRLLLSGRLMTHLHEIEQSAQNRLNSLMHILPKQSGVTEDMKAENPMRWAAQMNSLKHQAEEMILSELIYS